MPAQMAEGLFRSEVIEASRHRLTGAVVASVPPSSRLYTAVAVTIVLALGLLLAFGHIATGTAVRGVADYDLGTARVTAPQAGTMGRLHVRVGDRVSAGDPLATLSFAQGPNGLAAQIADLQLQIAELDRQSGLAGAAATADRAGLISQRNAAQQTLSSLERQRSIALGRIALAQRIVDRSGRLAREGAGTARQEEEARSGLLARRAEAEVLTGQIIATRANLGETLKGLSRVAIDESSARSELSVRRGALLVQADALRRSDRLVITSPLTGTVADLPVRPGQRVSAEASVATVAPFGGKLEAHLYAPSRAIGFVHPGQLVRLRFDAFPYQRYGSARGVVTAVSPVALDPANVDPALGLREPVFRVDVRIRQASNAPALKPGMTLSADLLSERRSLWSIVFGTLREAARF